MLNQGFRGILYNIKYKSINYDLYGLYFISEIPV